MVSSHSPSFTPLNSHSPVFPAQSSGITSGLSQAANIDNGSRQNSNNHIYSDNRSNNNNNNNTATNIVRTTSSNIHDFHSLESISSPSSSRSSSSSSLHRIHSFEIDDSQVPLSLNSDRHTFPSSSSFSSTVIPTTPNSQRHNNNNSTHTLLKSNHPTTSHNFHIIIPKPTPRPPSKGDKIIAFIMSLGTHPFSQGLTGKSLLYFTTIFVSLGVFLFGYDQGVMSGIITSPYFLDYFNQPSRAEIGTMVAILEIGALVSSLLVGHVGDLIGRRKSILYGSLVFIFGGLIQTFTTGLASMIIGRLISGVGVGFLSTIVPVYQSEISPPHNRGKLACIEFTGNIVGYSSSVWVDYASSYIESDLSWRLPLFIQCIMGALLFLGSFIIVETPRWLLDHDHDDEGMLVIANLHGGGDIHHPRARQEFKEIKESVLLQRLEGERSYYQMWKRYKRRVLIAMSSQMFAQLNGINVISYYAPLVFEQAGWVGRQAILMTGINSLVYILSTIPPWYVADRWGRRIILMSGALVMAVALSLISYFMYLSLSYTPQAVVILVIIYNAFFGYSWGPIPWLYPPEILPLNVRAKGASLSTASNWLFNFIVGEATPILQEYITWRLYLIHSFSCVCSFICVYFMYPETMGVNLEDMGSLFGDKSIYSGASSSASSMVNGYNPLSNGNGISNDARSIISQDTQSLLAAPRPDSPVLQPSAAALARGGVPGAPRSRSNSAGYYSPVTGATTNTSNVGSGSINNANFAAAAAALSSNQLDKQNGGGDSDIEDYDDDNDHLQSSIGIVGDGGSSSLNSSQQQNQQPAASVSGFLGRVFQKTSGILGNQSSSLSNSDSNSSSRNRDLEATGSNKPLLHSHDHDD